MKRRNLVSIRVWGDFAGYTRPEMKVERVSQPNGSVSPANATFWKFIPLP
jgi:hypothetical protein